MKLAFVEVERNIKNVVFKPESLHNSKLVIAKRNAAKVFCSTNKLIYKLTYCKKLTDIEIEKLIDSKQIELLERYKTKYNDKFKK
jgi:hypothetical protein